MSESPVVVVGAGPAGIGTALALSDAGVRPLVLEQAERVGSSWRGRYDRLRLNSSRQLSHLPGRPFPKGTPVFPSRDQMVEYLERHAAEEGIGIRFGTRVERIDPANGGWTARTQDGELRARQVVVATGYEQQPMIPEWSGRDRFTGRLIHSAEYRNPEPFKDARVLVVGPGCSGMEIAYDLAENGAAKVWLSARTPPNIINRDGPGPIPGDFIGVTLLHLPVRLADALARFGRRMDFGDLTEYGLPVPEEGAFARLHRTGRAPSIVDKDVIDAVKDGRIEVVRGVKSLDATGALLIDGTRVEAEAIISATGYRRGLEPLVGHLDVLDERGAPRAVGAEPAAEGLRFICYAPRPAALGYMGKQAQRAAKAIVRELRATPTPA